MFATILTCAMMAMPAEKLFKPTAVFSGTHSQIKKDRFELATTAAEWQKLWAEHRGTDRLFTETDQELEVDFDTQYVVAIFSGGWPSNFRPSISIGDTLHIRFDRHGPQFRPMEDTRTNFQKSKDADAAWYIFVVLPKPVRSIVVEEDTRGEIAKPAKWTVRATFALPEEKPFKPTAVFSGTHSQIKKERFVQVLDADAWKVLWQEHRGKNPRFTESDQEFEIDFDTHYIVAIFTGPSDWCSLLPRTRGNEVVVGFRGEGHQTEGGPLGGRSLTAEQIAAEMKSEAIRPYAFIVLPRTIRSVAIEQDVRTTLQPPAVWKHRTRFTLEAK